jgi:hypothetical protein
MINITAFPLSNGNLRITANNDARAWLKEACAENGYWSVLSDAFEGYSTNGGFTPFDAGDANPFVGLTSAPCIAESMDYPDSGQREVVGRLWCFERYMIDDPLDELKRFGRTTFQLAS